MDIVWVHSRRRASGTPEDFCVQLVNCLRGTDVSSVRVDKVRLTNSFRTVEHSNRYLYIRMGDGVVRTVALELGFYSAPELAQHILLRTGLTCEYISWSNSLRMTFDFNFHLMTDAELAELSPWPGPEGTSPSQPRSFNDVLRNPHGAVVEDTAFTTLYLNCSRYDNVYLTCSEFSSSRVHGPTHGRHNILCRIDVNTPLGTVLTADFPHNCSIFVGDCAQKPALSAYRLIWEIGGVE